MTERHTLLDRRAVAALLLCCGLWGLNQVAAKSALADVPALWQCALRSGVAAVLVALWARRQGVNLLAADGTARDGLLAGALFGIEFICIFLGLQYTSASRMAVFVYISPFVVALGMPFIARAERLGALQIGGLTLAFGGVAWAFAEGFQRPAAGPQQWLGDALGVTAGVLWGATTLAIRATALSRAAAEKTLLYQLLGATILSMMAALAFNVPLTLHWSALTWASMAFQSVVVSAFSYVLWFWLVRHYAATRLAAFTLLTPVFGLLFGAALLHDKVTLRLLLALAAVVIGILLVNRTPRRPAG